MTPAEVNMLERLLRNAVFLSDEDQEYLRGLKRDGPIQDEAPFERLVHKHLCEPDHGRCYARKWG